MSYCCRCRSCDTRRTLKKHPDEYVRPPRCESCGSRKWRWDRFRDKVEKRKKPCHCTGYWFGHRKGSGWCDHGKLVQREMERAA